MGADLYIVNTDPRTRRGGFEVSQEAVDSGYFRDCYNSFGLFGVMSETLDKTISWWQTSDKKGWFRRDQNEGLVMTVEGVKQWKKVLFPLIDSFLAAKVLYRREYIDSKHSNKVNIATKDYAEYRRWANLLKRFIETAIALNSEIVWSV